MSRRRRNSSSPESEGSPEVQDSTIIHGDDDCDSDDQDETLPDERPQAYSGQSNALPGLGDDKEPFYGPAVNGVDYLRMVRWEAKGIPELLSTQDTGILPLPGDNIEALDRGHEGGYWQDGAYTAKPSIKPPDNDAYPQAQLRYFEALLARFAILRATLRCTPPLELVEDLRTSQLISFPCDSKQARKQWETYVLQHDPVPAQLACMDEKSVQNLLGLIHRRLYAWFRTRDAVITRRINLWIWSALGKAPGREVLDSDEIAELRELAKRAIAMTERLTQSETTTAHISSSHGDAHKETDEVDSDSDDEAKCHCDAQGSFSMSHEIQAGLEEKLVSLDAIVTIVGEVYGQRDLLQARRCWELVPTVTADSMAHNMSS